MRQTLPSASTTGPVSATPSHPPSQPEAVRQWGPGPALPAVYPGPGPDSTAGGSQLPRSDGRLLRESPWGGKPQVRGESRPRHHLRTLSLSHNPPPRARGSSCAGSGGALRLGVLLCGLWGALRLGVFLCGWQALGGIRHMGTSTPDPSSLNEVRPAGGSSQAGGARDPRVQQTGPESSLPPRLVWSPLIPPRRRRAPSPPRGGGPLKQGLRRGADQSSSWDG